MRATGPNLQFHSVVAGVSLGAALLCSATASAAPLKVGPGEGYATPCAAVAAAAAHDEIQIKPGTYTDSCAIAVLGLTLRGIEGRPKIDLSGSDHPAQYKGIYVVTANDVTIENLELTGAHISAANGENAAAIRMEGEDLTVRNCYIHGNQNGILGGSAGTLTVEYSEFSGNGMGDGCNGDGCTHNLYIGKIATLYFRHNWSHSIATDTPDKGHLLKSRAAANYIEYNRITSEGGPDSYEVNLPSGGLAVLIGNVLQKSTASGNSTLFSWGEEGVEHPDTRVFIVNNTFVNDKPSGTFIRATGATLTAKNNVFAGAGTPSNTGALSADNLAGVDPKFVDHSNYDYRLQEGSPAIGKATTAGAADTYSLVAKFEYVHPRSRVARAAVQDLGAFEYGTNADAVLVADAGAGASDAGTPGGSDGDGHGSLGADHDAGAEEPANGSDSGPGPDTSAHAKGAAGGCALTSARGADHAWSLLLIWGLGLAARRRAHPRA